MFSSVNPSNKDNSCFVFSLDFVVKEENILVYIKHSFGEGFFIS